MTNVSVKVKRKTSAIPGKRMPLFLQIIYNRVVKRIVLDLKLTEQEWIETTQTILIPPDAGNERIGALMLIKETLERNLAEMEEIVQHLKVLPKGLFTISGTISVTPCGWNTFNWSLRRKEASGQGQLFVTIRTPTKHSATSSREKIFPLRTWTKILSSALKNTSQTGSSLKTRSLSIAGT